MEDLKIQVEGDAGQVGQAFAQAYQQVISFKAAIEGIGQVNLGGLASAMKDIGSSVANTDVEVKAFGESFTALAPALNAASGMQAVLASVAEQASAAITPIEQLGATAAKAFDWDGLASSVTDTTKKIEQGAQQDEHEVKSLTESTEGLKMAMEAVAGALAFEKIKEGFASMLEESGRANIESQKFINTMRGVGTAADPQRLFDLADALEEVSTFEAEDTIQAGSMLGRFGLTQKAIESLLPNLQDFAATMGGDLVSAADTAGRAIEIGSAGLRGLNLGFTKAQRGAFDMANETQRAAMIQTALQRQMGGSAALMASTAEGAMKQYEIALKNVNENLGKLIEAPVAGAMQGLIAVVRSVNSAISGLSDGSKTLLGGLVVGLGSVAGLAAGFVSLASGVGLVIKVWPAMIEGMKALRVAGLAASEGLIGVLAPLAAIAAGILVAIMVIGTLRMAWETNLGGMRTTITGWVKDIQELWTALSNWMSEKFNKAAQAVTEAFIRAKGMMTGAKQEDVESQVAQSKQVMKLVPVVDEQGIGLAQAGAFVGKVFDSGIAGLKDFAKLLGLDFDKFTKDSAKKQDGKGKKDGKGLDFSGSGAVGGLEVMAAAVGVSTAEFEQIAAMLGGSAAAAQQILTATRGQAAATMDLLALTGGSAAVAASLTAAFQGDADAAAKVLAQVGGSADAAAQMAKAFYGQAAGAASLINSLGGNLAAAKALGEAFKGNADIANQVLTAASGDIQLATQIGESFRGNAEAANQVLQATKGNAELTAALGYALHDNVGAIQSILQATNGNAEQALSMAQSFAGTASAVEEANKNAQAYWDSFAGQSAKIGAQIDGALDIVVSGMTQHMGAAGQLIAGAMQGAASAGPFGAIAAVIVQIVSQCQSFMAAVSILNQIIQESAQAFNPLFDAMGPILQVVAQVSGQISQSIGQIFTQLAPVLQIVVFVVQAFGSLIGSLVGAIFSVISNLLSSVMPIVTALLPIINLVVQVLKGLAPLFQLLPVFLMPLTMSIAMVAELFKAMQPALNLLMTGLKFLFTGIIMVAKWISQGVNAILDGIISLLNWIGQAFAPAKDLAKNVAKNKLSTAGFDTALAGLKDSTNSVTAGFDKLQPPLESTSDQLQNVPSILKVTALRFAAATGDSSTGALDTLATTSREPASTSGDTNTVNITTLNVSGTGAPDALVAAVKASLAADRFNVTGSTQAATTPNATPRTAAAH